jgi:hypothetical protein
MKKAAVVFSAAANSAVEAGALSTAHDRAASLRVHRTVPAVEGGSTAFRPAVGSPCAPG